MATDTAAASQVIDGSRVPTVFAFFLVAGQSPAELSLSNIVRVTGLEQKNFSVSVLRFDAELSVVQVTVIRHLKLVAVRLALVSFQRSYQFLVDVVQDVLAVDTRKRTVQPSSGHRHGSHNITNNLRIGREKQTKVQLISRVVIYHGVFPSPQTRLLLPKTKSY